MPDVKEIDIWEVMRANISAGSHWFSPNTMRFFGCKTYGIAFLSQDGKVATFVSSERDRTFQDRRMFTARMVNMDHPRSVENIGEFQEYASKRSAERVCRQFILDYDKEGDDGRNHVFARRGIE